MFHSTLPFCQVWEHASPHACLAYGHPYLTSIYQHFESDIGRRCPTDLTPLLTAVQHAVLAPRPRQQYRVGQGTSLLPALYTLLPRRLADRLSHMISSATSRRPPAQLQQADTGSQLKRK